jgi:hypothetical protein
LKDFGNLERIKLRDIWSKEAGDFTPWLAENVQALGKTLGIELELQGREQNVGEFSLDLLAKDLGTGRNVVIENQLTPTDHDHLGKLLTYASGFDASIIVWLADEIREEHRQTLDWLNEKTNEDTSFFGVEVEVIRIDNSRPAYNFKLIAFPNEWQKNKRRTTTVTTSRGEAYRAYFQGLIDELREKYKFTGARVGQPQNWYSFASGISGIYYSAVFVMGGKARVELYIDQGDADQNKKLFDKLKENQDLIEKEIGEKLEWERLDDKRASRIAIYRAGSIDSDPEELQSVHSWTVEHLLKFKKTFPPFLKKLMK